MKKLKKFAALLLVGVMALALLTACGGGGSGENAQAEASVMAAINDGRATPLKNNDSAMISIADENLDAYLHHGNHEFRNNVRMQVVDGKLTFTVVVKYDYNNTKLQDVIDSITNNYPNSNVDFKQSSKWTRVGVVAKTKSGQTYVAVSVQVGKLA